MNKRFIILAAAIITVGISGFWYAFQTPENQASAPQSAQKSVATTDKQLCPAFSKYLSDLMNQAQHDAVNSFNYSSYVQYAKDTTGNNLTALKACPKD